MPIDDDRIGVRHDGHEPDKANGQRPKRIPVNPIHFPARLTNFSAAGSGRGSAQEFVQVDGHIVSIDVATTADFSRNVLGQIVAPVLQRVESNDLDRVAELSGQKVGNAAGPTVGNGEGCAFAELLKLHNASPRMMQ